MANEVKERGTYFPIRYISKSPVQSLYLTLRTCGEIRKLINQIDIGKACSPDEISGYLIKVTQNSIMPILVGLLNACMSMGIFPACFKTA